MKVSQNDQIQMQTWFTSGFLMKVLGQLPPGQLPPRQLPPDNYPQTITTLGQIPPGQLPTPR